MKGWCVLSLHHWDVLEVTYSPFIKFGTGPGLGFLVVYATKEEAEEAAEGGYTVRQVLMDEPKETEQ